jgi:hypothetical protein
MNQAVEAAHVAQGAYLHSMNASASCERNIAPEDADGARTAGSSSVFPINANGITRWTDRDGRRTSITTPYPRGIKCPTLLLSSFSLVFCSFPVRRLPMKRDRSQHCALGAIFKLSGRLNRK